MTTNTTEESGAGNRTRIIRGMAILTGAIVVAAVAWAVAADRSPGDSSQPSPQRDRAIAWNVQGSDRFADTISRPEVLVVNVHVPYEGELSGTDLNIAYNRIVTDPRLPKDKAAPIAIYCRSGRMSTIAARALVADGRRNITELGGGMDAWEQAGRTLVGKS